MWIDELTLMGLIEVKKIAYDQQLLEIPCCEVGSSNTLV